MAASLALGIGVSAGLVSRTISWGCICAMLVCGCWDSGCIAEPESMERWIWALLPEPPEELTDVTPPELSDHEGTCSGWKELLASCGWFGDGLLPGTGTMTWLLPRCCGGGSSRAAWGLKTPPPVLVRRSRRTSVPGTTQVEVVPVCSRLVG